MKMVFINKSHQLRSGWKIALVLCFTLIFTILLLIAIRIPTSYSNVSLNPIRILAGKIVTHVSMILATLLALKVIDKKKLSQIGITNLIKGSGNLLFGLGLGAFSMTLLFFILLWSGNVILRAPLSRPAFSGLILTDLIFFIFVGFGEEIFSRGYCMSAFNQMGRPWLSALLSSTLFTLMHGMNPNVTLLALTNILLVGFLFAYMYLRIGNLWAPIGYHITWNYFQGTVFGFPVSGVLTGGVYEIIHVQDNLLTGGNFGPEGGILCTGVILLSLILTCVYPSPAGNRQANNL